MAEGTKVGGVYYEIGFETKKLIDGEREAARRLDRVGGEFDKLHTRVTKITAAITAALSAIAIEGLVSKLVTAQRQFDVMFASLKTMTGGVNQASAAWDRLVQFAARTPYSLDQAVNGFVKLKALGLDPSERAMTSFGNTASAMGKSLEQMIEAVADASTGEFERLKEFGIKASQQGDKVSLTFRGVTTTIGNNAAEITAYLTKIGETDFAGAMSERMKTLDGDISNLQDNLQALYLSISQSGFGDAMGVAVRKVSEVLQELSTSVKEGALTEYFDSIKPAIQAVELAGIALAGFFAGKLLQSINAATTAVMAKIAADRQAATAATMALKAEQGKAYAEAQSTAAARALALAEVDKAAAVVASTRASIAALAVQQQQAAANARQVAGTVAYFEAAAVEKTLTAQLAAAKAAETQATVALTAAEARLAAARGQAVAAAATATASTVALTAAQNAQATASLAASTAGRAAAAVLAALGGPIGIAITGLALLALNWDKVAGAAKDAAEISEQAAQRIAQALRKSPLRAGAELQKQLAEVRDEIKGIDQELNYKGAFKADPKDIEDLKDRRDALVKVAGEIQAAMDKLHGGAGRGKVNPDVVRPEPDTKGKPKENKFDALAYLAGLAKDAAEGYAKIDTVEREALRKNAQLLGQKKITQDQARQAERLIMEAAAQDRKELAAKNLDQLIRAAEDEDRARQQIEARRQQGRSFAQDVVADADPIARLVLEQERKKALLAQYAAEDQANMQLYAEAKVALEQQTQERITQILKEEDDKRRAAQAAQLQNYSNLFGSMADLAKTFGGEQSKTYKALFAVSKAFAIADSIIKIQQAMASAAMSVPFPGNLAAIATVAAQTAGIISTIRGTQFGGGRQYGGPVSAGTLYKVNETGRPEMFTGSNGSQYMLPTRSGSVTPADEVGGGGGVTVILQNMGTPQRVVSQDYDAHSKTARLVIADLTEQVTSNTGPFFNALRGSTNVRGRLG